MSDAPVLIVGGGPVGLATALDLGLRGTRSILIERDPSTGAELLAKAGTLNERTMEICRWWGVAGEIAHCGFPDDFNQDNVYCTALDGLLIGRDPRPAAADRDPPLGAVEKLRKCPQFLFDPILAKAALATGKVEILYGTTLDALKQDEEQVSAQLTDRATGRTYTALAPYLVAADGAGSTVRRHLGLAFEGKMLSYSLSAMIRAPEIGQGPLGPANRYMFIDESGTWANLTAVDGRDLWRFTLVGTEEKLDPSRYDITPDIERAFGTAIGYEILRVMAWRRSQCLIEQYREGRVLFAGDAAHTTSPTGGHGLNTGIGDALSLGWMLHAVLAGHAPDSLLGAYGPERRAVAFRNSSISTQNFGAWIGATDFRGVAGSGAEGDATRHAIHAALGGALAQEWVSHGVALGYRYEGSPIIVPDGTPEPADPVSTYVQTARPGHRAPHVLLGGGRSTIDLFGRNFVLFDFGAVEGEAAHIVDAAAERALPLDAHRLREPNAVETYEKALVLVRPDGHVAWRSDAAPADPDALIAQVTGADIAANSVA